MDLNEIYIQDYEPERAQCGSLGISSRHLASSRPEGKTKIDGLELESEPQRAEAKEDRGWCKGKSVRVIIKLVTTQFCLF